MPGTLTDTYAAALQHDLVDLASETHRLGVVRKPMPWFHGVVNANERSLGPPTALLEELAASREDLAARGICEEEAHNAAWEACEFGARYRAYLDSGDVEAAMDAVIERLHGGTDVALVCYENTDVKRCHRTILREVLERRL